MVIIGDPQSPIVASQIRVPQQIPQLGQLPSRAIPTFHNAPLTGFWR